jgi:hypothetical protein
MADVAPTQILSPDESTLWRLAYLDAFVDTTSEHFQRYIASPRQFSDGTHYEGYIWECLRSPARISFQRFCLEVVRHSELLVMADDHSRDRVVGAPLWPYPPNSVTRFEPQKLLESLNVLPEDIYVFDSSVSWTLVLTHEYTPKKRICWAVGI